MQPNKLPNSSKVGVWKLFDKCMTKAKILQLGTTARVLKRITMKKSVKLFVS